MKQIFGLFIFLLFFSATSVRAQRLQSTAYQNIRMLKEGALFVRLQTSQLKINGLKERGRMKEAEEIRLAQDSINKSIIDAFKNHFKFCPVYFFYSNHSNEIKAGNYKGILMDGNMQADTSFSGNSFLVGEFDESRTTQLKGFYIKDKNFELLTTPFPYMVKKHKTLVIIRTNADIAELLSDKFSKFY